MLNKLGLILSQQEKYQEAYDRFHESYLLNSEDPSTVFYLISSCIRTNNFSKISSLIISAEVTFKNQPQIIQKINLLKQKLWML